MRLDKDEEMLLQVRFTEDDAFSVNFVDADEETITLSGEGFTIVQYPAAPYSGTYTVTPTRETQTLRTSDRLLFSDVTINPIPSNYGLITYNGFGITVS